MFRVVIDALCFQTQPSSFISIFWEQIFNAFDEDLCSEELSHCSVVLLVRGQSHSLRSKQFKNIIKLPIAYYDYRCALSDSESLGALCRSLSANLFISTGYSIAYGLPNIGILTSLIVDTEYSFESKKQFLLHSIYVKSIPCHVLFLNSLTSIVRSSNKICDTKSFKYHNPPMLDLNVKFEPQKIVLFPNDATDFPFILITDSSAENIVNFLQCFLSFHSYDSGALPFGIVINSYGNESSDALLNLSDRFVYGIHIISCKTQYLPLLFKSALLSIFLDINPVFPFGIIYSLFYGCPVACAFSAFNSEVLSCVEKHDFFEFHSNELGQLFEYIQSLLRLPFRVSEETISTLSQKYVLSGSRDLLLYFMELTNCIDPPLDYYLPTCLPIDGVMGSHHLIE
jgi:hypothetical protein